MTKSDVLPSMCPACLENVGVRLNDGRVATGYATLHSTEKNVGAEGAAFGHDTATGTTGERNLARETKTGKSECCIGETPKKVKQVYRSVVTVTQDAPNLLEILRIF